MNLYIYTGATDLTEAAVTAANNLTAVTEFPALVYGDTEPLAIRFTTDASGTEPSWANVAGHVVDVTVGELGSTGAERYAATSNFTYADNTYSGTIYLGTPGFASWVASRRNGKGWLDMQIRHTDTSGYIETLAVLTCPAWGSVPGDFSAETLPVSYATYADVVASQTAAAASATAAAADAASASASAGSIPIIDGYGIGDFRQLDPVLSVAKTMNAGSAVDIAEYGDSTTVGYINGTTIGSTPAASVLQSTLRAFFNNTDITVYNRGVSGTSTSNVVSAWATTMAAEAATVIFLNYGMNDNIGLTHQEFADNLRELIKVGRDANKLMVLKTPNPARAQGSLGSQTKAELVKEYAEVVRQVGRETSAPVIDVFKAVNDRWTVGTNIVTDTTDGVHPSDTVYQAIGRECAWLFMGHPSAVLRDREIIPVSTPAWKAVSQGSTGAVSSVVGIYITANKLVCAVRVDRPGLDVYAGTALTASTTTDLTIKVDEATVGNIGQYASDLSNAWPCDMDLLIIENAVPGVHLIELNATSAELAIANYVRSWPTRIPGRISLSKAAGNDLSVKYRRYELPRVTLVSDSNDTKHMLTDIPMSCFGRTLDVQFTGTMPKTTGVVLMANRRSGSGHTRGGVLVFNNTTTGYLAVAEGGEAAYGTPVVIGSTDLSGGSHVYRITVTSAGLMTFYVDGSSVGTHTLVKPLFGGKLGFFMAATATLDLSDIEIY